MFQFKSAFSSNPRRLGVFDCFSRVANTIVAVYPFDFVPVPFYTSFLGERVLGSCLVTRRRVVQNRQLRGPSSVLETQPN